MAVDEDFTVREIEASSDTTPYGLCKEAENTLSVLVGERIVRGWSARVKELLRGAASCTHLMEMLLPMGTTALQGIRALRNDGGANLEAHANKVDTCYAYGSTREIVQKLWPARYRRAEKT
jgi:hypothetical protein